MKYIIFSDIDGTIYNSSKIIDKQTIKQVEIAKENKVDFVLATGNGYFKNIEYVAQTFGARYIICSNGAAIFDRKEKNFIMKKNIPKQKAQELLEFANIHQISADWWDKKHVYVNEFASSKLKKIISNVMTLDDPITISHKICNDVFKIEFYDNPKKIDQLEQYLKNKLFKFARVKPNHIEVTYQNVSKGTAIEWMAKKFDFKLENTMGIGDSANDLAMLQTVGYAYAMDNGTQQIKNIAQYHTSAVEQNGLGEAIQDFLYRKKLEK